MSYAYCNSILRSLLRPLVINNQTRLYARARWSHRNPAKVLLPFNPTPTSLKEENVISLDAEIAKKNAIQESDEIKKSEEKRPKKSTKSLPYAQNSLSTNDFKHIKQQKIVKSLKAKTALFQVKVFDEENEIVYEKCKDNDGRISSLLVKLKSKKDRQKAGQILVEGWRLIVDGLEAKCRLNYILFSRKEDLDNLKSCLPKTGVKIYKVPYKEIQLWSNVETSPGIVGVFEMPTPENIKRASKPFPMQIVCDNIRDPGNLGAILRVAAGSGVERVLLTKGCVDLWDSKVVRSAAGAHFRLPVHSNIEWERIPQFVEEDTSVLIAESNVPDNDMEDEELPVVPYYSIEYPSYKYVTLIIGGETEGISEDSYRFAASRNGLRINIPLQNGVDSLNTGAAAAVIAFEVKKQLLHAWTKAASDAKNRHMINAT